MNANDPHLAADAIDNTIDHALSALRDSQPRSGLNGRIFASLEQRRVTAPRTSRLHLSAHLAILTEASAAILAIASLLILHHHAPTSEFAQSISAHSINAVILSERSESKNPEAASRATNAEPLPNTTIARTTHTPSSRPERVTGVPGQLAGWGGVARSGETPVFQNCSDHQHPGCPVHDGGAAVGMSGITTTPTDAQLLADLHAPSHPAPPLPLTPQEKLFLRMLRYGNLTQLAELDPLVRAQHDADETTAFKAFFPDPPPLQQPNGDSE